MRKGMMGLGLVAAMTIGMSTTVFAAASSTPVVKFTEDNEFKYYESEDATVATDTISLDAFEGMAPGDTAVQKIALVNDSNDTMNFYLSEDTVGTLEEKNQASGGAYTYSIYLEGSEENFLDVAMGGYTSADADGADANTSNISEVELENFVYLVQLEPGQSTYLYLELYLNGEGNDNSGSSNYTEATADLELNFGAYSIEHEIIYGDPEIETTIIDRVIEIVTSNPYKGGDLSKAIFFTIAGCGVCVVIIGLIVRKNKKGENHEKTC